MISGNRTYVVVGYCALRGCDGIDGNCGTGR